MTTTKADKGTGTCLLFKCIYYDLLIFYFIVIISSLDTGLSTSGLVHAGGAFGNLYCASGIKRPVLAVIISIKHPGCILSSLFIMFRASYA